MRPIFMYAQLFCVVTCFVLNSGKLNAQGAKIDRTTNHVFPPSSVIVNVRLTPYLAKGDGIADDTLAIERALLDTMGQRKIVFVPAGTYVISRPIRWSKKSSTGADAWGFNRLQGENPATTTLRLKDNTFTDKTAPQPMMWCGGFGSADWFHNYVHDLTFDVGKNNPGAIALQFYSNNTGAILNVVFIASSGSSGLIGLDLANRDMNGPLLVKNVEVRGFDIAIRNAGSVNSQTFEGISLFGQLQYGFWNTGQSISIRNLLSESGVPAVRAESFTVVDDASLIGTKGASQVAAIELGKADFYARNVRHEGYRAPIRSELKVPVFKQKHVAEFFQGRALQVFPTEVNSLNLPAKDAPADIWENPQTWADVDRFGADPTGNTDSSAAIQKAIDSGATTVFFPGSYDLKTPIIIRGKVRRLMGTGGWIDYFSHSKPDIIIEDGEAASVTIEHFAPINGGVEVRTKRPLTFRSVEIGRFAQKSSPDLFLEDVAMNDLKINPGQNVWARQLNVENEGTHVTNNGGSLWVLGYKTERGGTLLKTINKGKSEILGNFSYTTTAGKLAPMFVTENASVFAFFNEVCYSGDPFTTMVDEQRGTVRKQVKRGEGTATPYVARP